MARPSNHVDPLAISPRGLLIPIYLVASFFPDLKLIETLFAHLKEPNYKVDPQVDISEVMGVK